MNKITLYCFHCGKKKEVYFDGDLLFAYQIAGLANKAGLKGILDSPHKRAVVFCDDNCLKAEITKKGTIRVRPLGAKEEVKTYEEFEMLKNSGI